MVLKVRRKSGLEIQNLGVSSSVVKEALRRMRLPKESEKRCLSVPDKTIRNTVGTSRVLDQNPGRVGSQKFREECISRGISIASKV